jgi:hypothetical protein
MPVGSGQTLRSTYPENVTGCRRVICYRLSAICYRLSAIGYRLLSQEVIRIDIDRDLHLVGQS